MIPKDKKIKVFFHYDNHYPRYSPIMPKLIPGLPLLCHIHPGFPYYAKRYPTVLPIKSSSTSITTLIPGLTLPLFCQHFYPRCCQYYSQTIGPSSLSSTLIPGLTLPYYVNNFIPGVVKIIVIIWEHSTLSSTLIPGFSYYVKIYLWNSPFSKTHSRSSPLYQHLSQVFSIKQQLSKGFTNHVNMNSRPQGYKT